jgi:hypothetical protein
MPPSPRCWSSRAGAGAGTAAGCWPPRSTSSVAWIPDGDRASTAFYESAGWGPDGRARLLEADGGSVRETRWHVALEEG